MTGRATRSRTIPADESEGEQEGGGSKEEGAGHTRPPAPPAAGPPRSVWIVQGTPWDPTGGSPLPVGTITSLPHPHSGLAASWLLVLGEAGEEGAAARWPLYALHTVPGQGVRSWLVGESVLSDGGTMMCTRYHPTFLLLPLLEAARAAAGGREGQGVFQGLADLLYHDVYPALAELARWPGLPACLAQVCEVRTGPDGEALYRVQHAKTLAWLTARVDRVLARFSEHAGLLDPLEGLEVPLEAVACEKARAARMARRAGAVIASMEDVLSPAWLDRLREHYGVPSAAEQAAAESKAVYFDNLLPKPAAPGPAAKKATPADAKKRKLSEKAKAAAVGMKSIASFFGKKA